MLQWRQGKNANMTTILIWNLIVWHISFGKGRVNFSQLVKTWYEYLINHQKRKKRVKLKKPQQVMGYLDSASYTLKTTKDPRLTHSAPTILAWCRKIWVCNARSFPRKAQRKVKVKRQTAKGMYFGDTASFGTAREGLREASRRTST